MKVALVAFGGHERYAIQLANGLAKLVDVLLLEPESTGIDYAELLDERVKLVTYQQPRLRNLANISSVRGIVKKICEFGAELVHFQGEHPWFFFGFPSLKRQAIVTTFHDVNAHIGEESLRQRWRKWLFRKSSHKIIVHGNFLKELMTKQSSISASTICVVPHGSYNIYRRWMKTEVTEEKGNVLFFGRLYKYKGLEYLLRAEPLVSKEIPQLKIVVAIHGEPLSNYEEFMVNGDHLELMERYIPNEEVAELFQKAALVVLPYIEASQSGVLNIAYAFGTPVVVTRVGALPEVVDDGETGLIVPPSDPKALAEAMVTILSDDVLRKEMGEKALRKAETELSWDRIAETTVDIYRQILTEKE